LRYRIRYHAVSDIIRAWSRPPSQAGQLVRGARLRSGLSQRSLARRAGTSQAAISRIERGLERPTFERLEQILAGLGWRPEIQLEPIAEHDAEPRRILADAHNSPAWRLESGINLIEFATKLAGAARAQSG
jgi:transcriptional regulator with XRE-family HTH domain